MKFLGHYTKHDDICSALYALRDCYWKERHFAAVRGPGFSFGSCLPIMDHQPKRWFQPQHNSAQSIFIFEGGPLSKPLRVNRVDLDCSCWKLKLDCGRRFQTFNYQGLQPPFDSGQFLELLLYKEQPDRSHIQPELEPWEELEARIPERLYRMQNNQAIRVSSDVITRMSDGYNRGQPQFRSVHTMLDNNMPCTEYLTDDICHALEEWYNFMWASKGQVSFSSLTGNFYLKGTTTIDAFIYDMRLVGSSLIISVRLSRMVDDVVNFDTSSVPTYA